MPEITTPYFAIYVAFNANRGKWVYWINELGRAVVVGSGRTRAEVLARGYDELGRRLTAAMMLQENPRPETY